jgi:hypothetical protein
MDKVLNCATCKHNGNCKVWEREKGYFEQFVPDRKVEDSYSAMFIVTKNGVQCLLFEENENAH